MPVMAQTPPVISPFLSPEIAWKDAWWPPQAMNGSSTLQHESDEDWYFDVIEYKKNGVVAGYAAVGFAGDKDFRSFTVRDQTNQVIDCQSFDNLGSSSPNCELIAISENAAGGITAVWASNALCFQYGICNEALGAPADDMAPKPAYAPANGATANSINNADRAKVFPNPSNGFLNILAPSGRIIETVDVFDLSGRLLRQQVGVEAPLLRIEELPVGIVFIRLSYEDGGVESLRAVILTP